MSRKTKKQMKMIQGILALILVIAASLGYGVWETQEEPAIFIETNDTKLEVFFFDVGQADSMLVMNEGKTMLIDGGNDVDGKTVANYLRSLEVSRIDYLIASHLHADHIGGLDTIIKQFEIGTIYMPDTVKTDVQVTELLLAMQEKNLQYETVETGDTFSLGNAECEIMHVDNEETENLNLSSIMVSVRFGSQSFLFTGDTEKEVEKSRTWNKYTVLKVGHHGSNTSSSEEFLKQVQPEVAVISVGKDNSYGHPTQAVLNRLQKYASEIYRTDEFGTIWLSADGTNYEIKSLENKEEM